MDFLTLNLGLFYQEKEVETGILHQRNSVIVGFHRQASASMGTVYDHAPVQPSATAKEAL